MVEAVAVYGAVLKEWRTLLLVVTAGPHRESGHRKVRDCETGQTHNYHIISNCKRFYSSFFDILTRTCKIRAFIPAYIY